MDQRSDDRGTTNENRVVRTYSTPEHAKGDADSGACGTELDEIRAQIEKTESELAGTLDAIQEKLSLDNMKKQAEEKVYDLTDAAMRSAQAMMNEAGYKAKEIGRSVGEVIKENPIPIALIGLGLGWLLMESSKSSHDDEFRTYGRIGDHDHEVSFTQASGYGRGYGYYQTGHRHEPIPSRTSPGQWTQESSTEGGEGQGVMEKARETMGGVQEKAGHVTGKVTETVKEYGTSAKSAVTQMAGQVADKAKHLASEAGHMAGQVVDTVKEYGSQAKSTVAQSAGHMAHQARHYGSQGYHRGRSAGGGFQNMLQDNPMAVGIAALAVGALIGFALPETRREQELMGETRDQLMERVREAGQEAIQKVEAVAQETGRVIQEKAQEQGLTASDIKEKVNTVAQEAKTAAMQEAEKQGTSGAGTEQRQAGSGQSQTKNEQRQTTT